jgi:flagellin-like hook-associated protein FlgL
MGRNAPISVRRQKGVLGEKMANGISLSSATRTNLLALMDTSRSVSETQARLSTGRAVNSALDDATSFFQSRSLSNRASDLSTLKDGIVEGTQVVQNAVDALESIEDIIKQMKALAASAKSTASADVATRAKLQSQYQELRSQIDHLSEDASYNGVNLIKSGADTLSVKFSESPSASNRSLSIVGEASDASSLGISAGGGIEFPTVGSLVTDPGYVARLADFAAQTEPTFVPTSYWAFATTADAVPFYDASAGNMIMVYGTTANVLASAGVDVDFTTTYGIFNSNIGGGGWSSASGYQSSIDSAINELDSALTTVRDRAATLGTYSSMLEIRRDFTETMINTLETGTALLVNADMNRESANMLSLETRQQLGTTSLSLAQQGEQSILRFF